MPVLRVDGYTFAAIESALLQDYQDSRLIIITEKQYIEELSRYHSNPRVKFIDSKGIICSGDRRNIGLQHADAKYIMFLDADDEFYDHSSVGILVREIEKQRTNAVGGSCLIYRSDNNSLLYRRDLINTTTGFTSFSQFQNASGFYRFIYNRRFLESNQVRFPSLLRFQDSVFMVRALDAVRDFYLITDIVYKYRKGHKPRLRSPALLRDHLSGVLYVRKYAKKKHYQNLVRRMNKNLYFTLTRRVFAGF